MIGDERLETFLNSMDPELPGELFSLEQRALADHVPIIRRGTRSFLRWILAERRPGRILEIGTAVGFSALFMAWYAPEPVRIVTVEQDARRIVEARKNFAAAGRQKQITLLEGDAAEILPGLSGPFDMIFMDAAKGQYPFLLPQAKRLMAQGGLLITDNVLQEGDILESRFAVRRRDRTIHKRMREYLYTLAHDEDLVCTVLPVGDGLAVCTVKRKDG